VGRWCDETISGVGARTEAPPRFLESDGRRCVAQGLGLGQERTRNGLAALAGTWSQEELVEFEQAVQELGEAVDEEVWR
jgi:hypothetical protein